MADLTGFKSSNGGSSLTASQELELQRKNQVNTENAESEITTPNSADVSADDTQPTSPTSSSPEINRSTELSQSAEVNRSPEVNRSSEVNQSEVNQSSEVSQSAEVVRSDWRSYLTVIILFLINLLNYMDRYTVSGVLLDIQQYYDISNSDAGLLQTSFICSYMVLSPVFGYMGDRYSRKIIMIVGILFWSGVTLGGSFIEKDKYWLFVLLRACVGIGEASYSTIAPTLIADLFVKDQRSNMLAIFYFAIPVGSGLGYIAGSQVALLFGDWKFALRVTPAIGILCVLMIAVFVREPERGEAEATGHLEAGNWCDDLAALFRNKSFVYCSLGFTCVAFVAGALGFWAPPFIVHSIAVQGRPADQAQVALIFGVITCLAGITGVACGSQSARFLRKRNPRADPLVCATGLLLCAPFLFFSLVTSQYNTPLTWFLIFCAEFMLCLNWSIVADIVLYVVTPTRRSTAEAFQILFSHLLGDAGSPYLIGLISDTVTRANPDRGGLITDFSSLQYALYMTTFVSVLGGGFFLACAIYVQQDKQKEKEELKEQVHDAQHAFDNPALDNSKTELAADNTEH